MSAISATTFTLLVWCAIALVALVFLYEIAISLRELRAERSEGPER